MADLTEQNDTLASADDATADFRAGTAAYVGLIGDNPIGSPNDVDMIRVDLVANERLQARTFLDTLGDSWLRVFDASGFQLESNDDYFGLASFIDFVAPTTGSYYIGVSSYANSTYDPNIAGSGSRGFYTGSYTLQLLPLERAPIAEPDSAITGEGSALTLSVLDNDGDPDGDPITLIAVNGVAAGPGSTVALASGARLTVNADGTLGYDPNGAFDGLGSGQQAEDGFSYTIDDDNGQGTQATGQVTLTLVGADNPPVTIDDIGATTERASVTIGVLGNDASALPGRPLAVTAINGEAVASGGSVFLASGARVTLNTDQTLTYDPNGQFVALGVGENAEEAFTYAVVDSAGNGGAANVAVTVSGLNDAPLAADDRFATDEETLVTLKVLANDLDPDGDVFAVREINGSAIPRSGIVTLPSGAVLRVGSDGAIAYDPRVAFDALPAGATVRDSFTYEIQDGQGGADIALATVQVSGFGDPNNLVPPRPFNALEYTASHPDLIRAFGTDQALATAHYSDAGFLEQRQITFDGLEYIASYQDLANVFGAVRDAGSSHYITSGFSEGRTTNFNALEYIASYADLSSAFGVNQTAGSTHYLTSGRFEGRSANFDGLAYIAGYADLIRIFGADEDAGAAHYIAVGRTEGRIERFDGLQYIASHADLIQAFGIAADAGSRHYIQSGSRERRTPDDFDEQQYLANYSDLQAAFGNDAEAATRHYIANGFSEGRVDEPLTNAAADFLL
jgi:VCBS repeat-containing protein